MNKIFKNTVVLGLGKTGAGNQKDRSGQVTVMAVHEDDLYNSSGLSEISYRIKADKGIEVKFEENSGKSILSGIKLAKL